MRYQFRLKGAFQLTSLLSSTYLQILFATSARLTVLDNTDREKREEEREYLIKCELVNAVATPLQIVSN